MLIPVAQEPAGSGPKDRQVRNGLLEARGEVIVELEGDDLDLATRGAYLVAEDDLALIPTGDQTTDQVLWYAVRSRCCHNRWSDFSNIVRVTLGVPPPPPTGLVATADQEGILLEWSADDATETRVERSKDGSEWEAITTLPASTSTWTDATAVQGQSWSYRLRGVDPEAGGDADLIGAPGPPVTVEHPDLYPPQPPEDLVCLPEGSRIRLRWRAAAGASAYEVRRHVDGGPAELVVQATPEVFFVDETPPAGNLLYIVRSVDEAGNSSEPARCETVVEEAP